MVKRGKRTAAVLLLLTCAFFSGCTEKQETNTAEKLQVEVWHYWGAREMRERLLDLVEEYNSQNIDYEIVLRYIPDEDFKKELALGMAEGKIPDLAMIDSSDFQFFMDFHGFVDLTEKIKGIQEFLPQSIECCKKDGRIYAYPFGMNCAMLYYNKEILSEYGQEVPKTWKELVAAAYAVTGSKVHGFAMPALKSEETLYAFLPLLWSMGGDVSDLTGKESREAFWILRTLINDKSMGRECISLNFSDLLSQFAKGNVAMMINTSMNIDPLRARNPKLDFGVSEIPEGKDSASVIGGEVLGVLQGGHEKEAIEFLQYLADKNRMESYMDDFDLLAPRKSVLEGQFSEDPLLAKVKEVFAEARTREFSREWPDISRTVSIAIEETIIGERSFGLVLKDAAEKIRQIREGEDE